MFIGRNKELNTLNKLYLSNKFTCLFGECKWTNERIDKDVLEKSSYIEMANKLNNVTLVDFKDILKSFNE
jgi:hypothetical protein